VGGADGDMTKPAQVTQGDLAEGVDFVAADAMVEGCGSLSGFGLEASIEDSDRSLAIEGAVRSAVVVVVAEGVELELQLVQGGGGSLLAKEALEGLVEALDFAAGLRVIGTGVLEVDAQTLKLQLEEDLAAAGLGGEDGGVVAEQRGRQTEAI